MMNYLEWSIKINNNKFTIIIYKNIIIYIMYVYTEDIYIHVCACKTKLSTLSLILFIFAKIANKNIFLLER